jgi:hypothetical protein
VPSSETRTALGAFNILMFGLTTSSPLSRRATGNRLKFGTRSGSTQVFHSRDALASGRNVLEWRQECLSKKSCEKGKSSRWNLTCDLTAGMHSPSASCSKNVLLGNMNQNKSNREFQSSAKSTAGPSVIPLPLGHPSPSLALATKSFENEIVRIVQRLIAQPETIADGSIQHLTSKLGVLLSRRESRRRPAGAVYTVSSMERCVNIF